MAAVLAACETCTDEAQKKRTSSDFLCRIMVAFLLLRILFFIEYSSQNSPKVDPETIKKGTQITSQTPLGAPGPPLVTNPVLRPLPESTFYDFGTPSGTPLGAKMAPWRAKKRPRCDESIKKSVPEGASEKNTKNKFPRSWILVPPGLENHALACEGLKF